MNRKISNGIILVALAPLVMALPLAMDIYVPAIPSLIKLFRVSGDKVQLTLNLFMMVSGLSQLALVTFADKFGRRQMVATALIVFAVGTTVCVFADDIWILILGRVIQSAGSSILMMLGFAIPRDICNGTRLAKIYSFINGIIAFSPMFAPFIGSYLDIYYGWQATFEALYVVMVLVLVLYFPLLRETWPDYKLVRAKKERHQFRAILKSKLFIYYTLATGVGLSFLYLFCAISSVVIITQLHIPEAHYGFYFCFMGISFFVGSVLSGFVVERLGIYKTVVLGFVISFVGGVIMGVCYLIQGLTVYNFVVPMLLVGMGGTFSMGAGTAGSMQPFRDHAAAASALGGAGRFFFSSIAGLIFAEHIVGSLPIVIPAIVFSVIMFIIFMRHKRLLQIN